MLPCSTSRAVGVPYDALNILLPLKTLMEIIKRCFYMCFLWVTNIQHPSFCRDNFSFTTWWKETSFRWWEVIVGLGNGKGEWKWICSWFFLLSIKSCSSRDLFYTVAIEDLLFLFFYSATYLFKTQLWSYHLPASKAQEISVAQWTKDRFLAKQV